MWVNVLSGWTQMVATSPELFMAIATLLRGYPKSFAGVFWGLMRRLGNGTRVGCQATVSEASGGCC
jgi:hypothetical protein